MAPALTFYEEKITHYTVQLETLQKRLTSIALGRLLSFLGLAITSYFLLKAFSIPLLLITLLFLILFITLVILNLRAKDRKSLLEKLLFVNTNELGILKDEGNGFPDGQAFLGPESYLDDLDIFGRHSLFHLLNRTTSIHGTERLANLLRQPLRSKEDIEQHQQALKALSPQADNRQLITAHGLLTGESEGNLFDLADWLKEPNQLQPWVFVVRWIIVLFNVACLLFLLWTGNYRPLLIGVLAGWILTGYFSEHMGRQHALLSKKNAILEQYALTLRLFNTMDSGKAPLLEQLQAQTREADRAIRKLARLSSYFDQQLNAVVSFLLNNLFAYNLHGLIVLEKWKAANRTAFPLWIDAVGNIECLNSLASFAFNNPDYAYPVPVDRDATDPSTPAPLRSATSDLHARAGLHIAATGLAHPLIPARERVPNDLTIGHRERLMLVTGSNMSGKTTFLRTTGVNLLLAQCGAPVCATSFSFTPMQILTSLRISDSLQEHTSYFMAELKKLQRIVHQLQSGSPALVLIDEILRGTNSEDKTYGSEQFILKLLNYSCLSLFATHDLSLGQLENEQPGLISNYCFESVIENGELHFNYLLQRGVARNRNASFLMKKMEII
ncbi:MAG TPA: hypothetical protein VL832_12015 [Puia sp.]|nr:hypothetical protein [Puia sp.]